MNWKNLKNSNTLISIFIDNIEEHATALEETLYSVSKQTVAPDLLVLTKNLSDESKKTLEELLNKPKIIIRTKEKNEESGEEKMVEIEQETDGKINYIIVDSDAKNFAQVYNQGFNLAIEGDYEWFMQIEREDIVALHWTENLNKYSAGEEEVSLFFPLIRNSDNGVFAGLMNEAVWVDGMVDEAGKMDAQLLMKYNCMFLLGAAIRPKSILEYVEEVDGKYKPLKESFRVSHYYEFLLRLAYNGINSFAIPRLGYELRTFVKPNFNPTSTKIPRNLSQLPAENGGIEQEEATFWVEEAKKQYFYKEDEHIRFTKNG